MWCAPFPRSDVLTDGVRAGFAELLLGGVTVRSPTPCEVRVGGLLTRSRNAAFVMRRDTWWTVDTDVEDLLDEIQSELENIELPETLTVGFFAIASAQTMPGRRRIDRIRRHYRRTRAIVSRADEATPTRIASPDELGELHLLVDRVLDRAEALLTEKVLTEREFAAFANLLAPLIGRQMVSNAGLAEHFGVKEGTIRKDLEHARAKLGPFVRARVAGATARSICSAARATSSCTRSPAWKSRASIARSRAAERRPAAASKSWPSSVSVGTDGSRRSGWRRAKPAVGSASVTTTPKKARRATISRFRVAMLAGCPVRRGRARKWSMSAAAALSAGRGPRNARKAQAMRR